MKNNKLFKVAVERTLKDALKSTIKMSPEVEEPIGRSFFVFKILLKTHNFAKISKNVRNFLNGIFSLNENHWT